MGLEIVYFAGAFVLLAGLIYGTLSYRYRDRTKDRLRDEATKQLYREEDASIANNRPSSAGPTSAPRVSGPNGIEPPFSEDDIQRAQFGPRGIPGASDPAKMTPQRAKKTPSHIDQGHVS